ncbi:MAG: arginine--tRNA ligase [Fimbriiglobus sp.]
MNLTKQLQNILDVALQPLLPDAAQRLDALNTLVVSGKPEFGDYQLKCAMSLGKSLGQKPQEVAAKIVSGIPANDIIESATVAGPGFINMKLHTFWIQKQVSHAAFEPRLSVTKSSTPKKYVIDYSGPNVAKPLHVGHLRSTIIGDALVRILRHLGHEVIGDNHLGDWGTQFGILLYGYKNHLDRAAYEKNRVRELARLYIYVRSLFLKKDDDETEAPTLDPVLQACREETAKLHAGDAENVKLWQEFMPACIEMLQPIYRRLDVDIDHTLGESFYNPMLADVVADLVSKGVAVESNGSLVIPNAKGIVPKTTEEQETEEPPALIRKRDGAFTYTTTDLATIRYRVDTWKPDAMLYVVDARQALHFRTLFANSRRWGYDQIELQHVMFGSILGPDRKPFKSRDGNVVELSGLIEEAVVKGSEEFERSVASRKASGHIVPELSEAEIADIAEAVGVGAMKYADLSANRISDYVFDYKKMLATDGNTATYMQYAYARCRGIFRKGELDWERFLDGQPALQLNEPAERALGLKLLQFEEAILDAAAKYEPHHITAYLWDLAKCFSTFFENCPVNKAPDEATKLSRFLLVHTTGRTIQAALGLLGIRTVEQM